jgi:hypothetical protein
MRKIKEISLALVIIPLLTSGCMQEKISAIRPSTSTTKTLLSSTEQNITSTQDTKLDNNNSNSLLITTDLAKTVPYSEFINESSNSDTLDELANLIDDSIIQDDTIGIDDSNWIELSKEEEIVETAKRFLGIKYVWAANGPDCFDCSGFTKYVFKQNGITLPRYSGHQANVGTTVSFDELQKGDLVFFDTEHKFRGKVNHVGIYIGDGKFIHASSAGKRVMITSFKEKPFYKQRFLRGERVIDTTDTYASL